jgi:transposase
LTGIAHSVAICAASGRQEFLENPTVPLDDNASERALRIVALGRKNFLFVGNDVAGKNLAVLLSRVRTCEASVVNPQAYLADVLMRVQEWLAGRVAGLPPESRAADAV